MAIQKVNLGRYASMTGNSDLPASDWNDIMSSLNAAVNGCIDVCNSIDGSASTGQFYVNGVVTTPVNGVVHLESNNKYILEGVLNGRVEIGTSEDLFDVESPTQVILNGVTIIDSSESNSAISYVPRYEKMIVTLAKNTSNHLVCTHAAERADNQAGALYSVNNMTIQGAGYLSCINRGGHGVKASELKLYGEPHIYCEAIHDGIHGSKLIIVGGGKYYINGANDAFGTRKASGVEGDVDYKAAGKMEIFGGEFWAYNLEGNVFDSEGFIYSHNEVMNTKLNVVNTQATGILLHTDVAEADQYNGVVNLSPSKHYNSNNLPTPRAIIGDIEQEINIYGTVTGADLEGRVYTANSTEVTISGYFHGYNFVFPLKSTTVRLSGAYIDVEDVHAFAYTFAEKNIKIICEAGTTNIIRVKGQGCYCISSENNVAFEPKNNATLFLSAESGVAVSGSEVSVRDGYGQVIAEGDVVGSQIIVSDAGSVFGGCLKALSIIARLSGKGQKGNINVIGDTFLGCVDTDYLSSAGLSDLADSTQVFYRMQDGSSFLGDPGKTIEPYDVIPYGKSDILLQAAL